MLTAVDVPLTIKSKDKEKGKEKILKALGGDDVVSRVLERKDGRLQLNLNPEIANEHGLRSDVSRSKKQRVVVRMSDPPVVVGILKNTHVFESSDLQYFGSGKRKRVIQPPEELKNDDLFLFERAPIFPVPSRFLTQASLTMSESVLGNRRKRMKTNPKKKTRAVSPVPSEKRQKISEDHAKKIKKYGVDKLFETHPVWSSNRLHIILNENFMGNLVLRKLVSYYGTYTQGGPWGRLWMRQNYDPTITNDSRMYQSIRFDIRVTLKSVLPGVREKFSEKVESSKLTFMGSTLKTQNYYCINEVCACSEEIKLIVQSAPIREVVHGGEGWFYTDTFTAILNTMKRQAVKLFRDILYVGDDFKPDPSIMIEEVDGTDEKESSGNVEEEEEEERGLEGFELLGDSESDDDEE